MLSIDIPGGQPLHLGHLVLDFNGTLACDGDLLAGVPERLANLAGMLEIHVITADTHGTVAEKLKSLPCRLSIIPAEEQDRAKLAYISGLGVQGVVAIGNGRNDNLMLAEASLGILIVGTEGASCAALRNADLLCTGIHDALDLLSHPKRLQATLRN